MNHSGRVGKKVNRSQSSLAISRQRQRSTVIHGKQAAMVVVNQKSHLSQLGQQDLSPGVLELDEQLLTLIHKAADGGQQNEHGARAEMACSLLKTRICPAPIDEITRAKCEASGSTERIVFQRCGFG